MMSIEASYQTSDRKEKADREKFKVALSSVLAAVFLTLIKIITGVMTGSLGILAEAAHSALDLIAAIVTFFAVKMSGLPADSKHTYGHGKIENISAFFETLLLLLTCGWIIYEAIHRMMYHSGEVEVTFWAFFVMIISIVVDFSRSRALQKTAKKYDSQALEADALHFSTDIWSSLVVIAGLILVKISEELNIPWLAGADAVAALGVAAIVIYISIRLGIRTVQELLDTIPDGIRDKVIAQAGKVDGVMSVSRVRIRKSGPESFADLTLSVGRDIPLERAHDITSDVEKTVREILPGADVVVHIDPVKTDNEGIASTIRLIAQKHALSAHDIHIYDTGEVSTLEIHIEVEKNLDLDRAHAQVTAFEKDLLKSLPSIHQVVTHIEPAEDADHPAIVSQTDESSIYQALNSVEHELGIRCLFEKIRVYKYSGDLAVSFNCTMSAETSITEAHHQTGQIEQFLISSVPGLKRVLIHVEPDPKK